MSRNDIDHECQLDMFPIMQRMQGKMPFSPSIVPLALAFHAD